MRRLTIAIPEAEAERLTELAREQFRETKAQASLLLVEAIRRTERRSTKGTLAYDSKDRP